MWKDATVNVALPMTVSGEALKRVFKEQLARFKADRWICGDTVYEEHVTSHRFDVPVGKAADPPFRLLRAVEELEAALKEANLW